MPSKKEKKAARAAATRMGDLPTTPSTEPGVKTASRGDEALQDTSKSLASQISPAAGVRRVSGASLARQDDSIKWILSLIISSPRISVYAVKTLTNKTCLARKAAMMAQ